VLQIKYNTVDFFKKNFNINILKKKKNFFVIFFLLRNKIILK
jgi:hypothetical protein